MVRPKAWVVLRSITNAKLERHLSHSPEFRGRACHRSAKASRSEDLEIEEPVGCR
jgi:hypothetical protein